MQVLAYDPYPAEGLDVRYVSLEELLAKADYVSLHCPLTPQTRYLINRKTIQGMKDGVYLVNTSRGGLIDTQALIEALAAKNSAVWGWTCMRKKKVFSMRTAPRKSFRMKISPGLVTFPNVLVTSHMGFFTVEAMQAIAHETLENARALELGLPLDNLVE